MTYKCSCIAKSWHEQTYLCHFRSTNWQLSILIRSLIRIADGFSLDRAIAFFFHLNNTDRIPVSVEGQAGYDFMRQSVCLVVKPITGCSLSFNSDFTTVDQAVN